MWPMRKIQTQGVHHITLVGAKRQTSIDFWEGVLGMPFVFEQPNLDNEAESHLYFDPGDGRLITVFTHEGARARRAGRREERGPRPSPRIRRVEGDVRPVVERLDERGIKHSGVKDRGFMDSIYFDDPLGLLIELAAYRFEPPHGHTHADVLFEAHKLRTERGDHNIAQEHLADAIELLVTRSRESLLRRPRTEEPVLTDNRRAARVRLRAAAPSCVAPSRSMARQLASATSSARPRSTAQTMTRRAGAGQRDAEGAAGARRAKPVEERRSRPAIRLVQPVAERVPQ